MQKRKKINALPIIYLDICPIDKNRASLEEIYNYGICEQDYLFFNKNLEVIKKEEINPKFLKFFEEDYLLLKKLNEYINFFEKNLKTKPFKLNLYWAKRVFRHESFTIIAPTGIGKTTFGIAISHFLPGKVYYLVPSKILLNEIEKKLKIFQTSKKILVIKKPKDKEKLLNEDFDILVTTSNFLHKNFDIIPKNFDLVFIDDADSLIRQPKNIDKVLKLAKITEEEINQALEIIELKRKNKEKNNLKIEINKKEKGIIIAASATLTPKTKRINLFKELLGFEIGISSTYLRNIEELYKLVNKENLWEESIKWIKKLGEGGFVYLSSEYNRDDLKNYVHFLNKNGINAVSYENFNNKNIEAFLENKIQVIVGFSNIRNPLTRGIDLPQKVRYALFVGIPKFILSLKLSLSPLQLFLISLTLREILDEKEKKFIDKQINFLKKISYLKEDTIKKNESLKTKLETIKNFWEELIKQEDFIEKIKTHPLLILERRDNEMILIVSDPRGYLQASGRTSRLYPLGLTKGLSLILAENEKLLKHLANKLKILGYQIKFKEVNEVNLEDILKKIDEDRNIVKKVIEGKEIEFKDPIETALVIVESPTKARTIANFFGKPARRIKNGLTLYEISLGNLHLNICATMGHFVDLTYSDGYYGVKKIDSQFIPVFQFIKICRSCDRHLNYTENFCPVCGSKEIYTKRELIEGLKKLALEVDKIYLASDPDAEGEKIAFDLFNYLYPYNKNILRIELHEITREEFLKRIKEPREINTYLVEAQLLRRISDRWVGFFLSEKIQNHFKNLNLSAGRVQTPILGWILERAEKVKNKIYYLRVGFNDSLIRLETDNKNFVKKIREKFKNKELKVRIKINKEEEEIRKPLPPYDTSNLLKDAFNFFKFGADQTMKLAQDLFERGLITYHRTDSTYISDFGLRVAREFLENLNKIEIFKPNHFGSPGTHEGIRPTKALTVDELIEEMIVLGDRSLTSNHLKLYGLIVNRFLASQVKEAKIIKINGKIYLEDLEKDFEEIKKIKEKGYLEFYYHLKETKLEEGEFIVKNLRIQRVPKEFYYTQGELIEEMKKRGLGRPSTYATFISTLLERKYILNKSGYLIPTSWGKTIYQYLKEKYFQYIDEEFTRILEKNMDKVESGEANYLTILEELFNKIFKNATY